MDRANGPILAIHKFARLIAEGKPIPIYGDGSTSRDYTYIDDIVQGIRNSIDYQKTQYEVLNLGNDCSVSLLEMVETIGETLGLKPRMEFLPEQPGDVPQTRADITKAQKLIDYQPNTPFREGIRQFAEWFEQEYVSGPKPVA